MNQRLNQLVQLAHIKEEATQKAYREFLNAQEEFTTQKERHNQLISYRVDYVNQLEVLGNEGSTVGRLRNRIDFIAHLDMALIQLSAHLGQLAKIRSKAELIYKQAKTAEEGVIKLIERVKKTEQSKIQRQEQKESDEYAQKQWYSKNMNEL